MSDVIPFQLLCHVFLQHRRLFNKEAVLEAINIKFFLLFLQSPAVLVSGNMTVTPFGLEKKIYIFV